MPRPTRLRSLRACAGFRLERFRSSGIGLHSHEMADLPEHTGELWALLVLGGAADLAQPERAKRAAVLGALPNRATCLSYPDPRHRSSSLPSLPASPRPSRPPAAPG